MLSIYYYELMGNVKEHEGRKYLAVDYYMLDEVLDKTKEIIVIEKFDNIKILIDKVDKLPDDITLENAVILMASVVKDDAKFYPRLFWVEAL